MAAAARLHRINTRLWREPDGVGRTPNWTRFVDDTVLGLRPGCRTHRVGIRRRRVGVKNFPLAARGYVFCDSHSMALVDGGIGDHGGILAYCGNVLDVYRVDVGDRSGSAALVFVDRLPFLPSGVRRKSEKGACQIDIATIDLMDADHRGVFVWIALAKHSRSDRTMNSLRTASWLLLLAAAVAGTFVPVEKPEPIRIAGYRVLAADFHNHTFPGDWALVPPWEAVRQAQRDGLDVISLAGQNHIWKGKVGKWFTSRVDGPVVFVGEEIVSPRFHMLAVGIDETVSWRQTALGAIKDIHRQGGIAIAAHPIEQYWLAYDTEAMKVLDAAEILHPGSRSVAGFGEQLKAFALRGNPAAIGDSDWRFGPMGWCRTFVFTKDTSESGILDAIRRRQTVVYDRGQWFGHAELIEAAKRDGQLTYEVAFGSHGLEVFSRIAGSLALLALIVTPRRRARSRANS